MLADRPRFIRASRSRHILRRSFLRKRQIISLIWVNLPDPFKLSNLIQLKCIFPAAFRKLTNRFETGGLDMAEAATKLPVKTEQKTSEVTSPVSQAWHPFEALHREVDRLFEDFGQEFWRSP